MNDKNEFDDLFIEKSINKILIDRSLGVITLNEVRNQCRIQQLVHFRCIISFILRNKIRWNLVKIGKFVNRDHSSIIHYLRKHQVLINKNDKMYKMRFEKFINQFDNIVEVSQAPEKIKYLETLISYYQNEITLLQNEKIEKHSSVV